MDIHKEGDGLSIGEEGARALEGRKTIGPCILVGSPCLDGFPHFCPPPQGSHQLYCFSQEWNKEGAQDFPRYPVAVKALQMAMTA